MGEPRLPAELERALEDSGAAERGRAQVGRWLAAQPDPEAARAALARAPERARTLGLLCAESRLYTDILIAQSSLLGELEARGAAFERAALAEQLAGARTPAQLGARMRTLLVTIGYRDVVCGQSLEQTLRDLSALADAVIERALAIASGPGAQRPAVGGFVVLALGKLGGEELNFSSDIDLLLVHDDRGVPAEQRSELAARYGALGRALVRVLSGGGGARRIYRVDLRLRPEGSRGPISVGFEAALRYYESRGRTWERQMLLKARPVAGDLALGRALCEALSPLVFRSYLNVQAISDIKALKRQLEARAQRRGDDIKEGPGGIRDIEFAVQFLQLLHGGRIPHVRARASLEAMDRLAEAGCWSAATRERARAAYRFLRAVEHRLMTWAGERTHRLPREGPALAALAGRLGFRGPDAVERMRAELERHRRVARRLLAASLHGMFREAEHGAQAGAQASELVLDPAPSPERIA
ncbi:MAG: bifunctional [glutamate--ammonia ligase]-adenylyl-L-tyrosine phosphorylase/[glutamate--ammonia-ligase] adenylyltransferase, partial [Planctomycetota bacterium]